MSAAAVTSVVSHCSGGMYCGVPMICDAAIEMLRPSMPPCDFASPRSASFTSPSSEIITFSGFRSRCTMPFWCAAASPAVTP